MRFFNPFTVWNAVPLASRTVTVTTNNDKTGYTASTVSDKTAYGTVRSIQKGTVTFTGINVLTGTATITALTDVTKAMVLPTGGSQGGAAEGCSTNLTITNTTTITATTTNDNGAGRTYTTGFVVIEFY